MTTNVKNIFNQVPEKIPTEIFNSLFSNKKIKIERIISKGQSSEIDHWYDQDDNEWIILLQGQAQIQYQDNSKIISLKTGDYLLIPAHTKHRVHWTTEEIETIWLAINFYIV